MFGAGDGPEKLHNFLGAKNDRQFLWLLGRGDDLFKGPVLLESDFVKETQRANCNENRTGRQFLFIRQIDLVGTNLLRSQHFRRLAKMSGEKGEQSDVPDAALDLVLSALPVHGPSRC